MSDWLAEIAQVDEVTHEEAAALFVESGVAASDWRALTTASRAMLIVARRHDRLLTHVRELEARGEDLAAAQAYSDVDGGRAAARLMARAAGEGVAIARRQAQTKGWAQ